MKLITKLLVSSLTVLSMQFAYAQNSTDSASSYSNEGQMAQQCAPAPSAKPSPKPCAPAPCPKPCPPKPCKPCPPVCFEGGYPDEKCCFPPAYNQPADFNLGPCPWDFWIDLSFTYWDAEQEGLDLAISSRSVVSGSGAASNSPDSGKFLFQDTRFKPGFKVGIGMDLEHDAWSGFAEYTWFRSTTNTHQSAPADPAGDTPVWNLSNWFVKDSISSNITSIASNIYSKWRLRMDLVDAGLIRPYYQGTHLIVAPFGGLRGQWIRQNLNITGDFPTSNVTPDLTATSSNKSNSWAVGPRAGCLGKWHLGWGIRLEGDIAASLVFTRYTSVKHREGATTVTGSPVAASLKNYNCLRAVNEMNLGLGWGSYFDCRNYHFDLLATYDFQVFWNQNVLRQLVDSLESGTGHAPSNLYLQGLTIKAQFDF